MTNFAYVYNDNIIYGIAVKEVAPCVPEGYKYYIYTDIKELATKIKNDEYDGIGTSTIPPCPD